MATPDPIEVADKIRTLLPVAKKAYGSQPPDSPPRVASDTVNAHLLIYVDQGGKVPALAKELEGEISLSGLRRRIRIARGQETAALEGEEQVVGRTNRPRGIKDPELIQKAAEEILAGRKQGGRAYGDAIRRAYNEGLSLDALAKEVNISYYSLWSAKRTSW